MSVTHTTAEGRKVSVDVFEGTLRDNLNRTKVMRVELLVMKDDNEEVMVLENLLRLNTYPACIAGSRNYQDSEYPDRVVEGMTFDQFLDIPDQFLTKWADATFTLNPGWSSESLVPQLTLPNPTVPPKST